jgi:hypothetical protein
MINRPARPSNHAQKALLFHPTNPIRSRFARKVKEKPEIDKLVHSIQNSFHFLNKKRVKIFKCCASRWLASSGSFGFQMVFFGRALGVFAFLLFSSLISRAMNSRKLFGSALVLPWHRVLLFIDFDFLLPFFFLSLERFFWNRRAVPEAICFLRCVTFAQFVARRLGSSFLSGTRNSNFFFTNHHDSTISVVWSSREQS